MFSSSVSPRLTTLIVLLAVVSSGSAQNSARTSRVRFPNEESPQQPMNPSSDMMRSESQAVPIIITAGGNGLVNGPHYIIPKSPSDGSPFGEVGPKGYAEGLIFPHSPFHPGGGQKEYHQTVPPPGQPPLPRPRLPYGLSQSFVMHRPQHQAHRPRFESPERLPYHVLRQRYPNQHAHHQIFASGMTATKDSQKHPDVAMYRYSIVTNHGKPRPDQYEMEISHGIPDELMEPSPKPKTRPIYRYTKPKSHYKLKPVHPPLQKQQKNQGYHDFSDFEQDSQDYHKGSSHDVSGPPRFQDKKKKTNSQDYDINTFPKFENDENFSFEDFPEFPQLPVKQHNQKNKIFPPQRKPGINKENIKTFYKPQRESGSNNKKLQQNTPNFETIKSIELADGEFHSGEDVSSFNFSPNKPHYNINQNTQNGQKGNFKISSKQPNNDEERYSFNFPQRSDRVKKPSTHNSEFDFPGHSSHKKQQKQTSSPSYDFDLDFPQIQSNKQQGGHNFGSDWIPINGPEGAVPAKSYNIPAPDLSRESFEDSGSSYGGRDWGQESGEEEREEEEGGYRFPGSQQTVYGVQKGRGLHTSGEDVHQVSATFRVGRK